MKAPLCPIQVYVPLELIHVNFTSIEMTMELNQVLSIKNVLVLMDHFTRYMMALVTKDQKAKTVMCILYKHFISVFGAPAKLLSDRGTNFTSVLVENSAQYLASRRVGLPHIMHNAMDRWKDSTKCFSR